MSVLQRIGILGAGAWGTALANACARAARDPTLYDTEISVLREIERKRTNSIRLPGVAIEDKVKVQSDLAKAADQDLLLLAVPTQNFRSLVGQLASLVVPDMPLVACAKGIERATGKFVTEIIAEVIPRARPAILSGPSFASELGRGLPVAVTIAAHDPALAAAIADSLGTPTFRLYQANDVRGVEIGGAAKNVLAVAAGIVAGRELGASAQAALIARGFAELARFGRAYGAKPETLMGLSGLGDLILTCFSPQSRNYSYGFDLGRGKSPAEAGRGALTEGAFTAPILVEMARRKNIDMPIAAAVDEVVAGRRTVDEAIAALLSRPMGMEA